MPGKKSQEKCIVFHASCFCLFVCFWVFFLGGGIFFAQQRCKETLPRKKKKNSEDEKLHCFFVTADFGRTCLSSKKKKKKRILRVFCFERQKRAICCVLTWTDEDFSFVINFWLKRICVFHWLLRDDDDGWVPVNSKLNRK